MKSLAFIKTHKIDNSIVDEYLKIKKSNVDVIVVLDNKDKKISNTSENIVTLQFGGISFTTLLIDFETFMKYNLPGYYHNEPILFNYNTFMWYNCDYPLYIVQQFFFFFYYYWQIEYDVYYNGESYSDFFEQYETNTADLLVCRLGYANEDWWAIEKTNWIWGDSIKKGCCILPVCRLSSRCCQYLYNRRLEHGKIYKNYENDLNSGWTYCEIFVATEVLNNKEFTAGAITNQYITDSPILNLFKDRIFLKPDNKLYHPVK